MIPEELAFSVMLGLLLFQRKSRFITLQFGTRPGQADPVLTFGEGLILLLIDSDPDMNVRDIAALMRLERSWVSRIIADLEKRRFIQSSVSPGDRRNKMIRIAKKGEQELSNLVKYRAKVIAETYKDLTHAEQEELRSLLKDFADGLRAPSYLAHAKSHPIDAELARISWMTGSVGEDWAGTRMNINKCQVFLELVTRAKHSTSASELAYFLPMDMSTISRILLSLEKEGFVGRASSSVDSRLTVVTLNDKGMEKWTEVKGRMTLLAQTAFRHYPQSAVKRLSELMVKATQEMPARVKKKTGKRIEVRAVDDEEAMPFITGLFDRKRAQDAEKFASALSNFRGQNYGLYHGGNLSSLIRVSSDKGKDSAGNFIIIGRTSAEKDAEVLVKTSLKLAGRE